MELLKSEIEIETTSTPEEEVARCLSSLQENFNSQIDMIRFVKSKTDIGERSLKRYIKGESSISPLNLILLYSEVFASNSVSLEDFSNRLPSCVLSKIENHVAFKKLVFNKEGYDFDFFERFNKDFLFREIFLLSSSPHSRPEIGMSFDALRFKMGEMGVEVCNFMIENEVLFINEKGILKLNSKRIPNWTSRMAYESAKHFVNEKFNPDDMDKSGDSVCAFYHNYLNDEAHGKVMDILKEAYEKINDIGNNKENIGHNHTWMAMFQGK